MKAFLFFSGVLALAAGFAADPVVSDVKMSQDAEGVVTVTYELENAPAVVTLDFIREGVSIGPEKIRDFRGDANCVVDTDGTHTITWFPKLACPGLQLDGVKPQLTVWRADDTPDIMVADISPGKQKDCVRYYTSTNYLPGGLLSNPEYRMMKMVFKRMHSKDVTWWMGPDSTGHNVTLDHDYYIAVFETTLSQWLRGLNASRDSSGGGNANMWVDRDYVFRPADRPAYNKVRAATANNKFSIDGTYWYPNDPSPSSCIYRFRTYTGFSDLDLPSEAEWEFAARGGFGNGFYGDGSEVSSENMKKIGRFKENGGWYNGKDVYAPKGGVLPVQFGSTNFTAHCGSYKPNAYGLYDMNGNVAEWCLDAYYSWADMATNTTGAVMCGPNQANVVLRGGSSRSTYENCKSTSRESKSAGGSGTTTIDVCGFRVVTRAGLK